MIVLKPVPTEEDPQVEAARERIEATRAPIERLSQVLASKRREREKAEADLDKPRQKIERHKARIAELRALRRKAAIDDDVDSVTTADEGIRPLMSMVADLEEELAELETIFQAARSPWPTWRASS